MVRSIRIGFGRHWLPRAATGLTVLVLSALIAILVWVRDAVLAETSAHLALDSDQQILVSQQDWIVFQPRDTEPAAGVIFYPGGKAEPAAYAPILRDLARRGYLVVLLRMPLNLAFLGIDQAGEVIEHFGEISHWFVAGHSLGGVAASEFIERHPGQAAGLILWASYPARSSNLSAADIPVLSIFGTSDELATPAEIEDAAGLLPPRTRYVPIEGGGHWNFANFALEKAGTSIPRAEQQEQVLDATQAFIGEITGLRQQVQEP